MRSWLTTLCFLLPACGLKNAALRVLGHRVGPGVRIGPNLVHNVARFEIGAGSVIGVGNVFRGLRRIELGPESIIGQWNWFSTSAGMVAGGLGSGALVLGEHAGVVSRHYLDCTGGIELEPYAVIGGLRSTLLTHQADFRTNTLSSNGIHIGAYSLVNAGNNLVPGANVPARSVTAMGAVITPGLTAEGRLYAGVPARDIKAVDGPWFDRRSGRLYA